MNNPIKTLLAGLAASLALAAPTLAQAQSAYPNKTVRWLVPYAAGGGTDAMARALTQAMGPALKQPVVVDNRPGAATNIAVAALTQSKPDGYTVMQAENAALLFNEHMFGKLPYKPATDFSYIGAIGRVPVVLVVHPDFPARTLAEFRSHVAANPGKLDYASPGIGSPHHMAMALLEQKANLNLVHVPYKGAAPALQDLMGGQVKIMMLDLASGAQLLATGKVRPLAVALPQRVKSLPNVPTFAEQGLKDVNAYAFHGLIGPAGLPADVTARLNAELNKALADPAVVKLFADYGFEALPGTPEDFRKLARSESERWGQVIKTSGVRLD